MQALLLGLQKSPSPYSPLSWSCVLPRHLVNGHADLSGHLPQTQSINPRLAHSCQRQAAECMAMNRTQLEERGPGSSSGLRETRALRLTGSNQAVESTAEHLHAQRGNYHCTTKSQPKEATFARATREGKGGSDVTARQGYRRGGHCSPFPQGLLLRSPFLLNEALKPPCRPPSRL